MIGLAIKYKNLFISETRYKNNAMLVKDRNWPIYILSFNF